MKKLFTMMAVCLCSTMAYAQSIILSEVDLTPGKTQDLLVLIGDPDNYTAFQFDLTLPKGVSVKDAKLEEATGADRKLENALVDAGTNKYRFLSYDMKNAKFGSYEAVTVTLEAAEDAVSGEAETADVLYVDPEGNSTTVENDMSEINISEGVSIPIGASGATTFVCDADLDFTDSDLTAYVVIGIELEGEKRSIWMAGIKSVPAGTPIVVKGSEGTHVVYKTTLKNTYYKNLLVGNNTDAGIEVTPDGSDQYLFLSTSGFSGFTEKRTIGAHKAYIRAKALPEAKVGSDWKLTIGDGKRTTLCANVDLDFSDQADLTVYTVMGYDGSYWNAPIKKASAGTPLYIKGPAGEYTIKSAATQAVFANMLVGNNSDAAITIQPTDGEFTNLFLSSGGFSTFTEPRQTGAHKSYLQILTSYYVAPASTRGEVQDIVLPETEAMLSKLMVDEEGNATAIHAIEVQQSDDTWYNLSGQRISAPTKKGLYIKGGKKIVVK